MALTVGAPALQPGKHDDGVGFNLDPRLCEAACARRSPWVRLPCSLDSMMMAGWSASAVVGGFLLDHHGFGTTFTITAVLQVTAAAGLRYLRIWCFGYEAPLQSPQSAEIKESLGRGTSEMSEARCPARGEHALRVLCHRQCVRSAVELLYKV